VLRITETNRTNDTVTLKLEGRVAEEVTAEIGSACDAVLASGQGLKLDLSELVFIDRRALPLFQKLEKSGIEFINCSPFISALLKKGGRYADNDS
jgi:hypothetical protein